MYLEHFGLTRYPFRLSPDVDFLYMSRGHAKAKAYLDYTVVSLDGFVVITGEIGAGKTTLLNKLMSEPRDDLLFLRIDQTQLTETEFLQAVLAEADLHLEVAGKVPLLNELKRFLVKQSESGRRVVLAVDEAQSLDHKVLEEIRLLSGLEHNKERLVSVILVGQPELARMVNSPALEQLSQRVRLRFHLDALSPEETREYVRYRMRVAGAKQNDIFAADAFPAIDLFTGGVPRLINSICDMALLTAYVESLDAVNARCVEEAATELEWGPYSARPQSRRGHGPGAAAHSGGVESADGRSGDDRLVAALEGLTDAITEGFAQLSQAIIDQRSGEEADGSDEPGSRTVSMTRVSPSPRRSRQ